MEVPTIYACLAILGVGLFVRWFTNPLRSIPTVGGPSAPLLSYVGAVKWIRHAREIVQEGYEKHYGSAFKLAMLDRWLVVITGPKLVEEVRKYSNDALDIVEGLGAFVQLKYTLGMETHSDPFHVEVVRDNLTRRLPSVLPDVIDELTLAIREHIPTQGNEWVKVNVSQKARAVVARASSRVFVGLPLCRNQDYLDLALNFTMSVIKDRALLLLFPDMLKPIVARYAASNAATSVRLATPYFAPMIEERRRLMAEHGDDWTEKPNDMLQWIMEVPAARRDPTMNTIVKYMLLVNFAAMHTTSNTFSHALFHLAERPELLQPLREEIEPLIQEGWTKSAMDKMWKLDSFLRESQRHNGVNVISLMREAHKDVTLSDGTFIPKGTLVAAPVRAMNLDDDLYEDAMTFDPFRFARMRERDGEALKHQYTNPSVDYISWGHGKHACPGRFFAANELKAMLAYIVLNYDVMIPGDGKRPANLYWGPTIVPAPTGEILFRKRQVSA